MHSRSISVLRVLSWTSMFTHDTILERISDLDIPRETGLLTLTESQFGNLQSLFFNIGRLFYVYPSYL